VPLALAEPGLVAASAAWSALWLYLARAAVSALLHGCLLAQDAFVMRLMECDGLDGLFDAYNMLSGFCRETSNVFGRMIVTVFPAVPVLFLVQALVFAVTGARPPLELPVVTLSLFFLLRIAASISAHSCVIPVLLQQSDFGQEIDFERWCMCWSIQNDRAAMRIRGGGPEVNGEFLAKAIWVTVGVFTFCFSQLRIATQ